MPKAGGVDLPNVTVPQLKEDSSNWIAYRERMISTAAIRGLDGHLIGSEKCPEAIYAQHPWNDNEIREWKRVDQLCLHLILSSIPDSALVRHRHHITSFALWSALEAESLAALQRSRIRTSTQMSLMFCPEHGDIKAHCYKMKGLHDEYLLAGGSILDCDFKDLLLASLPENFRGGLIKSLALLENLNQQEEHTTGNKDITSLSTTEFIIDCIVGGLCDWLRTVHANQGSQSAFPIPKISGSGNDAAVQIELAYVPSLRLPPPINSYSEVYSVTVTAHMSPYREHLTHLERVDPPVRIDGINGGPHFASEKGRLILTIPNGKSETELEVENVLLVDGIGLTLISVNRLDEASHIRCRRDGLEMLMTHKGSGDIVGTVPYSTEFGDWMLVNPNSLNTSKSAG